MSRIYLDMCCFNRPFDNQTQLLVRLQTEAKLFVQDTIRAGDHTLVWSAVLDLENAVNPESVRRDAIQAWKPLASVHVDMTPEVEALAEELAANGVKPMDALHVASAINADAEWFLTTDHGLLRKTKHEDRVKVVDPVDFVRFVQDRDYEN
jgi:predicted nucleic acid-binding protein